MSIVFDRFFRENKTQDERDVMTTFTHTDISRISQIRRMIQIQISIKSKRKRTMAISIVFRPFRSFFREIKLKMRDRT